MPAPQTKAGRLSSAQKPGWTSGAGALLLILALLAVYWPALRGDYIWDDDTHISANPTLRSAKGLWDIWFHPGATCQYYPLSFTGFWIGYHLWGLNPLGYHLLTMVLHGVGSILLWQVLRRLEVRGAWLAGALFALHPVNVMSVAWMTELKNTLAGTLVLGAAWAYLRFARLGVYETKSATRADWRWGLLALALFQLAMFAKTAVSFLPATLLLVAWWKRGRIPWRILWPVAAMFALVLGMGWLTLHLEQLHGAAGNDFRMGLLQRILVSGRSFWFYLGKLFFPYPLTFIYARWAVDAGAWWQYVYPLATLGLLGGLWRLRARLGKGPFVALLHFYLATSLLVLIQVLYMMRYAFVTDHWQYFGCMSVLALVAAGIAGMLGRPGIRARSSGTMLVAAWLLGLALLSRRQCAQYVNGETLWLTTLKRNPACPMAYYNLGQTYFQQGRPDKAIPAYQKVLQLNPDEPDADNNLGSALLQLGRVDEAIAQYRKALQLNPDSADAYNNLGNALLQLGQMNEALNCFQKALALKPDNADAEYNLGNVALAGGLTDDAIAHFKKALADKPDYAEAHNNLGNALLQSGQVEEAITQYRNALIARPDFADAHNNLGNVFLRQGRFTESIRHYQKALTVRPDDTDIRNNLAVALVQNGDVRGAVGVYLTVLQIQPDNLVAGKNLAWLLATWPDAAVRNGRQAVVLAQRAVDLSGGHDPEILGTLAAACAEASRFPEAVAAAQRALSLATAQANTNLVDELGSQLKLYQAGNPFHGPAPAAPVRPSP